MITNIIRIINIPVKISRRLVFQLAEVLVTREMLTEGYSNGSVGFGWPLASLL